MCSTTIPQLKTIAKAFQLVLDTKCWALSNGKKPWNYDRGFCLTWSDPDLFLSFWEASDLLYDRETFGAGIGLFLGVENRIACLDLDGALDANGTPICEHAQRIVAGSCTFTETSVSGRGLHLFYEVDPRTEPFHLRAGISGRDGDFFTGKRFIRLTGNVYGNVYPIRYLPANHVEYFRDNFGKAPMALPEIKPFTGLTSDRSLSARLSGAGIPYKHATIIPQPFHQDHGGIVECIETLCPNIAQHTTEASPYARFVRCADGLVTGRCFHAHCDPETLRAAGKSMAGMLTAKIRAAGDPTPVYQLLEKCEKMGMHPISGNEVREIGYPAVVEACEKFLRGRHAQQSRESVPC
jgi:hypothetical protein